MSRSCKNSLPTYVYRPITYKLLKIISCTYFVNFLDHIFTHNCLVRISTIFLTIFLCTTVLSYFDDFLDHIFTHNCFVCISTIFLTIFLRTTVLERTFLRFFKSCSCCSLYAGNKLSLVIFGSSEQLNTLLLEKQVSNGRWRGRPTLADKILLNRLTYNFQKFLKR